MKGSWIEVMEVTKKERRKV